MIKSVVLRQLPDGYSLHHPIYLNTYRASDCVWVIDRDGFLFGSGETAQAAVEDYKDVLLDYYRTLQSEKEYLAPTLRNRWEILDALIIKGEQEVAGVTI